MGLRSDFHSANAIAWEIDSPYPLAMRARMFCAAAAMAMAVWSRGALAAEEVVPLYTNEDLDRMFGPPPPSPSDPVDKSTPADWAWVEQFIDRQYARVDADRRYDLDRAALRVVDRRTDAGYGGYGYGYGSYPALGLGYPASTWWNTVHSRYSGTSMGGSRGCRDETGRFPDRVGHHGGAQSGIGAGHSRRAGQFLRSR